MKKDIVQSNHKKPSYRDLNKVSGIASAINNLMGLSKRLKKK